jgi:Ca2+-binding EF-hand superfamily protein
MRKSAQFLATLALGALLPAIASAQAPANLTRAAQTTNAEERFKRMDTNGDGRFDRAEYLKARNQAKQQAEGRIRQMLSQEFAELDGNKDGGLTPAEIDAKVKIADAGKKTLARLDKDKNGKVSAAEYTSQASALEPTADADQQIRQWDGNGDKVVTRQEFVAFVLAQFDSFDANKDGTVTEQEAAAKLKAAAPAQAR